MKKSIFLILCLFLISGCTENSQNNTYKIELNKEPYSVCYEKVYFSEGAYGNELKMDDIIETITFACEINKLDNVKDEINDILNSDYTKEEILYHLSNLYKDLEN